MVLCVNDVWRFELIVNDNRQSNDCVIPFDWDFERALCWTRDERPTKMLLRGRWKVTRKAKGPIKTRRSEKSPIAFQNYWLKSPVKVSHNSIPRSQTCNSIQIISRDTSLAFFSEFIRTTLVIESRNWPRQFGYLESKSSNKQAVILICYNLHLKKS